jgi:hypothetical protein
MNCVNKDMAATLHLSRQSCARYGLQLCTYIHDKTVQQMQNVASASIMFDEASDIQMHKHSHVFVNVSSLDYYFFCIITLFRTINFLSIYM